MWDWWRGDMWFWEANLRSHLKLYCKLSALSLKFCPSPIFFGVLIQLYYLISIFPCILFSKVQCFATVLGVTSDGAQTLFLVLVLWPRITFNGVQGNIRGARDQNQASHIKGKCPVLCSISLSLKVKCFLSSLQSSSTWPWSSLFWFLGHTPWCSWLTPYCALDYLFRAPSSFCDDQKSHTLLIGVFPDSCI